MADKSSILPKPAIGLIFRIGRYSRFWGWTTPVPVAVTPSQTAVPAQNPIERPAAWSNVAEWLKRMHAQADSHADRLGRKEE